MIEASIPNLMPIDSAIVFPEIAIFEKNGETYYKFPNANPEYKWLGYWEIDGICYPMASKDGRDFVLCLAAFLDGEDLHIHHDVSPLAYFNERRKQ